MTHCYKEEMMQHLEGRSIHFYQIKQVEGVYNFEAEVLVRQVARDLVYMPNVEMSTFDIDRVLVMHMKFLIRDSVT